jgi:AbrB family looped-hinge helix DNA binding protein
LKSYTFAVNRTSAIETVSFTTKGQIVIPAKLRRLFQIESGTRAIVEATPEGILLKPVTNQVISRLHGILKPKPESQPFSDEWEEHRRRESDLEDR